MLQGLSPLPSVRFCDLEHPLTAHHEPFALPVLLPCWSKCAKSSGDLSVTPELLLCCIPESPSRGQTALQSCRAAREMHREPARLHVLQNAFIVVLLLFYPWEEHLQGGSSPGSRAMTGQSSPHPGAALEGVFQQLGHA